MGTTAIGKAWLWGLPENARYDYITRLLNAAGDQTPALEAGFDAAFNELDSIGVCTSIGECQKDVYGIVLPIRVGCVDIPMALSCGAVDPKLDASAIRHHIVPVIKLTAIDLGTVLRDIRYTP
ncbi:hypothetical protein [Burkholderia pseudomultivorans]|uniref:hypothetical protein n=1 Tax=Burkholderia pseudomultivorans TaxID=1207504 RepID=UPI000A5A74F6